MRVRRHRITRFSLERARFPIEDELALEGFDLSKSYIRWYDEGAATYVYEQKVDDD